MDLINDKLYVTARARIVTSPEELPREMAHAMDRNAMNETFVWVAGRYVEADRANRNGQYWTLGDLEKGHTSIQHTPLNLLHDYERPIGVLTESKLVQRRGEADDTVRHEVQVLGLIWGGNFPQVAEMARTAHANKSLWYSMECIAESKQCMECEEAFAWATASEDMCEHLAASPTAPRRFVNPIFLGGALIMPPSQPGWDEAEITEVARDLTVEYANRKHRSPEAEEWEKMMRVLVAAE